MCQSFRSRDSLLGVEYKHSLEEVDRRRVGVLELVLEGLSLTLGQRFHKSQRVLAGDGVDDIIRGRAKEFRDDGELVDVVLAGEKGLSLQHLREDTSGTPDVHLDIVFLPGEHDFGSSVVSCGDVARHLGVLDTGQSEIADLQITVFVDENVAGLQVTMDDASGVNVFEAALQTREPPSQQR